DQRQLGHRPGRAPGKPYGRLRAVRERGAKSVVTAKSHAVSLAGEKRVIADFKITILPMFVRFRPRMPDVVVPLRDGCSKARHLIQSFANKLTGGECRPG